MAVASLTSDRDDRPSAARHVLRRAVRDYTPPALVLVGLIGLWEAAIKVFEVPRYLAVAPSVVVASLVERRDVFLSEAAPTAIESVLGFALGAAFGIFLATVVVHSDFLSRSLMPLMIGSQVIPKVAIAPLLLLWLGYGLLPKIVLAAALAFFPVVISHAAGMATVPRELLELSRSLGANRWRVFTKIRLPYSLPSLFAGLKVASTLAIVGAVIGEFVGASEGLGYLLITANFRIDTPMLFASLVLLSVLGIVLYLAVVAFEAIFVFTNVIRRVH
ncbi:MAG: NitT/TauT family transport system permease protein [Chloroflexota bacterium]|nr:NitT/TauT family transport system permease protein [Chloroflexota bacterium]